MSFETISTGKVPVVQRTSRFGGSKTPLGGEPERLGGSPVKFGAPLPQYALLGAERAVLESVRQGQEIVFKAPEDVLVRVDSAALILTPDFGGPSGGEGVGTVGSSPDEGGEGPGTGEGI